jgi:hypothetical protein
MSSFATQNDRNGYIRELNSCRNAQSISTYRCILLARSYLKNSSFLVLANKLRCGKIVLYNVIHSLRTLSAFYCSAVLPPHHILVPRTVTKHFLVLKTL